MCLLKKLECLKKIDILLNRYVVLFLKSGWDGDLFI